MKKLISITAAFIIAAMSVISAGAFVHPDYPGIELANDFDDNLSVTGYSGTDPVLVVPETVYNKPVTRFEEKALRENTVIRSVIMHDNMTNVRQRAMYQCKNLSYVYYSKKLEVIGKYAFAYNSSLTSAFLRNTSIRELYDDVYLSCANLEYVSLPDTLTQIDGAVFEKTAVRKIVIPNGVTFIGSRCFADALKLEKIYVPASVEVINTGVLANAANVTVYTPEGSAMQTYCEENNIRFENLSEDKFPSRLLGDTNGDRELDINDVTFIQREIAGYKTDFYPDNCDFNGDCKLNINDATDIQLRLVGLK
ncbi:MAG: leucine-rich repeat protein [Ruminococcus sp.]|nr:leucine-rich repeat protein [Ruminococcus sp.]